MPLLWGNTRCKEAAGWDGRIASKLMVAGGVGAVVGSVLSVVQQQPLVRFTAASTASFLMLTGCFSVVQEGSRLVRCRDSPLNSVLGGAATGALLFASHGQPGARGAVICAAIGGVAHLAAARVEAAGGLQQLLIAVDLLDPPPPPPPGSPEAAAAEAAAQAAAAAAAAQAAAPGAAGAAAAAQQGEARPWWHQYLPLRRMSDQEFEDYKAKQDDVQRKRIEAALAGGLPVMVDRARQDEQQQPQPAAADGSKGKQ
ncbi:mitochondrial import inner membrane translocase subunit tim17 [Chlorella sorokiniana]|uniref:Mitochondrial import inner membrane translocase subunit tim17 n=1 Tax=Chlorella sorokiniana TaxID=3076 RepID=A0A2P6TRL5_CHLSO|nr:mitochondrial import inner membrane translocase subunit tim17 [Chlorella sorokiniana]|eukprot:PRW56707.1 mitochondrial import inner membrane translocase subunit tim17 [Chlorella sorokiniana]